MKNKTKINWHNPKELKAYQKAWRESEKGKAYQKEYQKSWRESSKGKENYLKKKYNLTIEEYDKMVKKQNNKCAICGNCETTKRNRKTNVLVVDHNHKTGKVRGLLCRDCNLTLGHLNEDIFILKNCIKYLEKWASKKR